jgi:hypothetical protein
MGLPGASRYLRPSARSQSAPASSSRFCMSVIASFSVASLPWLTPRPGTHRRDCRPRPPAGPPRRLPGRGSPALRSPSRSRSTCVRPWADDIREALAPPASGDVADGAEHDPCEHAMPPKAWRRSEGRSAWRRCSSRCSNSERSPCSRSFAAAVTSSAVLSIRVCRASTFLSRASTERSSHSIRSASVASASRGLGRTFSRGVPTAARESIPVT